MDKAINLIYRFSLFSLLLAVLIVYQITAAPSVVQIDAGELATVQLLPGIAHPTGYPLFTMLGFLLSKILFFITPKIQIVNLLARLYTALAVIFIFKINYFLLEKTTADKKERFFQSAAASLLLAFSVTFWQQSASVEVYLLHLLLTSVAIYTLLIAYKKNDLRSWIYFALALALSFGNHMTTVMLLPGVAFLYFKRNGFTKNSILRILLMLLAFFPLLAAEYSFLIFLAKSEPVLNWGNVVNFENLLRHLTGKQYQVWMFSGAEVAKKQFFYFVKNFGEQFAYVGLIPILLGLRKFKKAESDYLWFSVILFFSVLASAINYNIHDIDSYFLLAYVSASFFAAFGFAELSDLTKRKKIRKYLIPLIFLIPLFEIFYSFNSVSERNNYVFEDYTKSALNSVEQNSIILTYQWDYFVSPSYYFRYVENYRRDVAVVDKELLRRSWYYKQLGNNYPFVLRGLEKTTNAFLQALKPFESGGNYNSNLLEKLYREIISGIIANGIQNGKAVYVAPELIDNEWKRGVFKLPKGYAFVPCNYFFKVVPDNKYYDCKIEPVKIRFFEKTKNVYTGKIKQFVKTMLIRRALYEMQSGKNEKAKEILKIYLQKFPNSSLPNIFKKLF